MFKRGWLYLIAGLVITVVLVIATTVAGTAERAGTTTTVTVFADEPGFTDTGVMLAEGESFNVSTSGTAKYTYTSQNVGPNGYPFPSLKCGYDQYHPYMAAAYLAPGLNCWSLVGRIGPTGVIFPVGTSLDMQSPDAGQLYLGFNDDYYPNNSGTFVATIR
jgi:hypothetical protein